MKVIDLLNKIANGEEVPKKIKKNWEYEWQYDDTREEYCYMSKTCSRFDEDWLVENILNNEVEILEEEKKIPEKSNIDFNTKLPVSGCSENEAFMMTCISHLGKTIDSLIDYFESKGE